MSAEKTTAQEDLAFLRQLVSTDDAAQRRTFGRMYALWGAAFAVPLLLEWARVVWAIPLPGNFWGLAAIVVTILLVVVSMAAARRSVQPVGTRVRAWNAVFAGIGFANIAVLVALVFAAYALRDGRIMMLHATVVFAFQGAAWYVIWSLRKRLWFGVVAGGWFVAAIATGVSLRSPADFILLCALGLLLLMVLPGLVMARSAKTD